MWPDSLHLVIPGNTRPQQWDRTRAAFGISLLLTLCILGLIGVLYGSLPSPRTPPHPAPTSLVLLADGQAAEYQGASLGIYDRLNTRYTLYSFSFSLPKSHFLSNCDSTQAEQCFSVPSEGRKHLAVQGGTNRTPIGALLVCRHQPGHQHRHHEDQVHHLFPF